VKDEGRNDECGMMNDEDVRKCEGAKVGAGFTPALFNPPLIPPLRKGGMEEGEKGRKRWGLIYQVQS
jgi:hypothetical protein